MGSLLFQRFKTVFEGHGARGSVEASQVAAVLAGDAGDEGGFLGGHVQMLLYLQLIMLIRRWLEADFMHYSRQLTQGLFG